MARKKKMKDSEDYKKVNELRKRGLAPLSGAAAASEAAKRASQRKVDYSDVPF